MRKFFKSLCAATVAFAALEASAEENTPSWLFVQTAANFTTEGDTLTMPYEREIFGFTDRPDRLHAHLNAHEFERLWHLGGDDFSNNPPNAVLTWVSDNEVYEAEIELLSVSVDDIGRTMKYDVIFEAGDEIPASAQFASLFVDALPLRVCSGFVYYSTGSC